MNESIISISTERLPRVSRLLHAPQATGWARRHPMLGLLLITLLSNVTSSVFNILYNSFLIIDRNAGLEQTYAFTHYAIPIYNGVAYPLLMLAWMILIRPVGQAMRRFRHDEPMTETELVAARRRTINLPAIQVGLNVLGWLPGAVLFPLLIVMFGGSENAGLLTRQFACSFALATLFATVQTFVLVEWYLLRVVYPVLFYNARPADVPGGWTIPFRLRLHLFWGAVALTPLLAVLAIAFNFDPEAGDWNRLLVLATAVALVGGGSAYLIFALVGGELHQWINTHAEATDKIRNGNLGVQIQEPRPDSFGKLTDRFNDMVLALQDARHVHETMGQFVSHDLRDQLLNKYQGLEVALRDVTVLFADIRGFTKRSTEESPVQTGVVLNRFLTLAFIGIEAGGGLVNKFMGDGVMALFGVTGTIDNHPDQAVTAARTILHRLARLNDELQIERQQPLEVGIGIHTGLALVGCFGATFAESDGTQRVRREFTAIGKTVNLAQRIEQLTKTCGGPILLSDTTRKRMKDELPMQEVPPQHVHGIDEPIIVHRMTQSNEPDA